MRGYKSTPVKMNYSIHSDEDMPSPPPNPNNTCLRDPRTSLCAQRLRVQFPVLVYALCILLHCAFWITSRDILEELGGILLTAPLLFVLVAALIINVWVLLDKQLWLTTVFLRYENDIEDEKPGILRRSALDLQEAANKVQTSFNIHKNLYYRRRNKKERREGGGQQQGNEYK